MPYYTSRNALIQLRVFAFQDRLYISYFILVLFLLCYTLSNTQIKLWQCYENQIQCKMLPDLLVAGCRKITELTC